jgi:hypothetical protein
VAVMLRGPFANRAAFMTRRAALFFAREPTREGVDPQRARLLRPTAEMRWHGRCTTGPERCGGGAHPNREDTLIDKIGFLVRFWELKARHATLGQPLSSPEQIELLSLMQLVTGDFKMPEPGTCERPADALPAQLIGEGTILPVEVRCTCAAALLVASVKPMTPGERAIIRISDAISGIELTLPCSVAWVYDESPCIMALVVDGIPTRAQLDEAPGRRAANVLSMARPARLVG